MTDDEVRARLAKLVRERGSGVLDPRVARAAIRDLFPGRSREADLLIAAAEAGIPERLARAPSADARDLERYAADVRGRDVHQPDEARWAVETWAIAVSRLRPEEATASLERGGERRRFPQGGGESTLAPSPPDVRSLERAESAESAAHRRRRRMLASAGAAAVAVLVFAAAWVVGRDSDGTGSALDDVGSDTTASTGSPGSSTTQTSADVRRPPANVAPWSGPALAQNEVPSVLLNQWAKAENKATCRAIGVSDPQLGAGASPRSAFYSGGWGMAYDKAGYPGSDASGYYCPSCGRGVVIIAGAGVDLVESPMRRPATVTWSDGSKAVIVTGSEINRANQPEGTYYRADIEIAGQRCLYYVTTLVSREHLDVLLSRVRFVAGAP